jgi:hypothetical protein
MLFLWSKRDQRIAAGVRLLWPHCGLAPRQAVFLFGQLETDASLQACAYFGRIVALPRVKQFLSSVNSRPTHRSTRALTSAESWPYPASSGFYLRSTRDRRIAPRVRLLRPNRGLTPRQAVFIFGQLETDASLQACAYFGRIVALPRVKRFLSSVNSRPTHRSTRALTSAESWPYPASIGFYLRSTRDRRIAPLVRLLRPNRGLTARQAVFIFGHDNK